MNYIILNGVPSDSVSGLLISSLPPITKPMMRVQREEIDGRNGDLTTPLGYAAYDREVTIGLHGHFDVDSVIRYFNSSGTAIFSNEPDKVYQYRIDGQIDLERLIRFRTARVIFHVQPFKSTALDDRKTFTFDVGDPLSFDVRNAGNIESKPKVTINGSGTVNLSVNGLQIFVIELGTEEYITIDSEQMEAYKDGVLKNRLVQGDYSEFALVPGNNTISLTGSVTSATINNYSRWI